MIKIAYEEQNLRTAAYDRDTLAGQCTYVVRDGLQEIELRLGDMTDAEREIILKGCLINYYRG